MTQYDVAQQATTSRPALSAYERGRKSPTLETAGRILAATGHQFDITPVVRYERHRGPRGRVYYVASRLPRLPINQALRKVLVARHLPWQRDRLISLRDRQARKRLYEAVLTHGSREDLASYLDGALLVDVWEELRLPADVRASWQPVIDSELRFIAE